MNVTAAESITNETPFWKTFMKTVRQFLRTAGLWLLRPRNPQVTSYFRDTATKPQRGRPTRDAVRAVREQRSRQSAR